MHEWLQARPDYGAVTGGPRLPFEVSIKDQLVSITYRRREISDSSIHGVSMTFLVRAIKSFMYEIADQISNNLSPFHGTIMEQ